MADSIVGGLFGMSPEQYDIALRQQEQATGAQLALLSPFERRQAGIYSGGAQLGRGLGGLMGVEDPQLKQLTMVNQLASQFDTSTSGGVAGLAQALANRGLQAPALQLGQRALEMRKLEAEAQAKTMERLTNEQKNAAAIADASGATRSTPEWTNAYKTELARLTSKDTLSTEQKNFAQAKQEGYPGTFNQWLNEQNVSKRQVVNVPLGQVFDKFFTQKSAEEQAKNWDLYGQAYATLPSTREKLSEVRNLIDQSFSGTGANVKLGASKLARSLNLPIDVNKASNTEIVEALTTQFAISELKKNFGSNPAVKDFEAQLKVKPGILQEPETFKKLVDKLDQGLQAEEIAYKQGKAYQKANKGSIEGFDPYAARADATSKLIKLRKLVDKAQSQTITESERQEAKKLQGELNAAQ